MRSVYMTLILLTLFTNVLADEFDDFDKADPEQEYYEANVDIDKDGVVDIYITSLPRVTFGNAGGFFEIVYRKKNGTSKRTKVFAHPMAFSIEPILDNARAWVYTRSSSTEGYLSVYDLTTGQEQKITIFPNDPLGEKLYNDVFSGSMKINFSLKK